MDARVRYTKKVIKEVFLTLLEKTPLDKITVTEICKEAQINRATFYKYYNNPSDLLNKLEQERLDELHQDIIALENPSVYDVFRLVLHELQKNKSFYQIVFLKNGDLSFRDRVFGDVYEYGIRCLKENYPNLPARRQEWLFAFIAEGFNGLVQDWQQNGMNDNVDDLVEFVRPIVKCILNSNIE